MELLKNPALKTPSFMVALCGQLIMMILITLAFVYGVSWIVVILQIWICIVFFLGMIPMMIDPKYLTNRLRWEQTSIYPAVTITLYWLLGSDIIFSLMWFVGAILLIYKNDIATKKFDYEYTKRESIKKNYGKDNVGDTYWHT